MTREELDKAIRDLTEEDFQKMAERIKGMKDDYREVLSRMGLTYIAKIAQEPHEEAVKIHYIISLLVLEKVGLINFNVDIDWK